MSSSAANLNSKLSTLEKSKLMDARGVVTGTSYEQLKKPVLRMQERLETSPESKVPSSSGGLSLRFEKAKKPSIAKGKKLPQS